MVRTVGELSAMSSFANCLMAVVSAAETVQVQLGQTSTLRATDDVYG